MGEPNIVVLPGSGDGDQNPEEIASTIQQALHERAHPEPEHPGPFKQILDHPDSLYKYINWEDPIRTLGIYVGALSLLFGTHFLPLTQFVLKAGVTILGAVSVAEFTSRSFSENSLSTRLRPKEYRKIPESTLNATLNDIHDFIQYAVVQAQRIVYGEDLNKTFAAFIGCSALYWLIKLVPPFWLAVMGLTAVFTAPLVSSPQGRRAAHDASVRAQELASAAGEKSKVLAQDGKAKAAELSSKGKQTASGISTQARDTASNISGTTSENIRKLPQTGTNAMNSAGGNMSSAFGKAKEYIHHPTSNDSNRTSDGTRSATGRATDKAAHLSNTASDTVKHMAPGARSGKPSELGHQQNVVSALPAQTSGQRTAPVADTDFKQAATGDAAAPYSVLDRPRGTTQAAIHGAAK